VEIWWDPNKTIDGDLIGQAGPSDALFAQLWGAIAAKYAGEPYVIFGLMNEVTPNSDDDYGKRSYIPLPLFKSDM
jgi:hypothetical protein